MHFLARLKRLHAGCDDIDDFLTFHRYDDAITVGLIVAVKDVIGVPLEVVLELFGEYFFTYCYQHGYDEMLKTLGDDFRTFIQNLDSLHALLAYTYKDINAPSFRCEDLEDGTMLLHYYSSREGLHHIVIGLCRSVGREMFQMNVSVEVLHTETLRMKGDSSIFHVTFKVKSSEIQEEIQASAEENVEIKSPKAKKKRPKSGLNKLKYCMPENPLLTTEDFCEIFPYHIMFDEKLIIKQCGSGVLRWSNLTSNKNIPLKELFVLVKPEMTLTYDNIKRFSNANYVLESRDTHGEILIKLRGQMVLLPKINHILFIGSPRLASLGEMEARNIFLSDIPLYDVTRELVLLNQQRLAEVEVSKKLDETTAELKKTALALDVEKKKTELLLYQMLPRKVADQLKDGKRVDAERFSEVTILFSDIVTFTNIASAVTPIQIVSMLNSMYTKFDELTETHNVYKVETIGDAYMVVAGAPEVCADHAANVANFSLDMVSAARQVLSPATGRPLQIRVGFHCGPVVAGVVGDKMPRYCLFGDSVNTSSRMESHGSPGKIHVSPTAYKALADNTKYVLECRGGIEVKGKGLMTTYWLRGLSDGTTWNDEYDGKNLIKTSTFEYYKQHGLPQASANGNGHSLSGQANGTNSPDQKSNVCSIS